MAVTDSLVRLWRSRAAGKKAASQPPVPSGEAGGDGETCRYVAIIMDGNGRWAQRHGLPVAAGHRAGVKALRRIIERALDHDVKELTVFSFSTENWRRPPEEVAALMDLFVEMIEREVPDLHKQNVRVRFLGRRTDVPPKLLVRIEQSEALTAANTRMTFYIAFNYGGRAEMADAAAALAADAAAAAAAGMAAAQEGAPAAGSAAEAAVEAGATGEAPAVGDLIEAGGAVTPVSAATVSGAPPAGTANGDALRPYLYAPEMHDPELLIRTSGEMRISNFLLWQLAYTELYFTPTLWPDMGAEEFDAALAEFASRRRRYGAR